MSNQKREESQETASPEAQLVVWFGAKDSASTAALQTLQPGGVYPSVFWVRSTVPPGYFLLENPLYL